MNVLIFVTIKYIIITYIFSMILNHYNAITVLIR